MKETHQIENNEKSQAHLNANAKKFSAQCQKVYDLLMGGIRLTSRSAMIDHGIGHLARRIKDLKDFHKIDIKDEWEVDADGKTTRNLVWFIEPKQRKTKAELTDWWQNYLKMNPGTKLIQSNLFDNKNNKT